MLTAKARFFILDADATEGDRPQAEKFYHTRVVVVNSQNSQIYTINRIPICVLFSIDFFVVFYYN